MNSITEKSIEDGQKIYTPLNLKLYDLVVLTLSNPLLWKCSTHYIVDMYRQFISQNHLDVGVGTGYFLSHRSVPKPERLGLLDLNQNALDAASLRVSKNGIDSECYRADILNPLNIRCAPFESVSLNYLYHCIPGAIDEKVERSLSNLRPILKDGATVFGSSICSDLVDNMLGKKLMRLYQRKGIFHNQTDTIERTKQAMYANLDAVEFDQVGAVVFFKGKIR